MQTGGSISGCATGDYYACQLLMTHRLGCCPCYVHAGTSAGNSCRVHTWSSCAITHFLASTFHLDSPVLHRIPSPRFSRNQSRYVVLLARHSSHVCRSRDSVPLLGVTCTGPITSIPGPRPPINATGTLWAGTGRGAAASEGPLACRYLSMRRVLGV